MSTGAGVDYCIPWAKQLHEQLDGNGTSNVDQASSSRTSLTREVLGSQLGKNKDMIDVMRQSWQAPLSNSQL